MLPIQMMEIRRSVKEKITRIQRTKNGSISKREFVRKIKKMKPYIISQDKGSSNRISSADLSLFKEISIPASTNKKIFPESKEISIPASTTKKIFPGSSPSLTPVLE